MLLSFEQIDFGDVDRAAIAEIDHDDGEPDGRLGRGHRKHDHGEDLPDEIGMEGREGDEVQVHGKQHQLDRHQDDDHVLAIEEDAENAEREQDRGDGQVVGKADGHDSPLPVSTSTSSTDSARVRCTWRLIL